MLLTGVFGLPPLYHEDDAQRAVYCALFILKALAERDLHASVGVTTGIVFSGSVGSNMRREYSILGVSTTPSALSSPTRTHTPQGKLTLVAGR
jgi:class 3 adenylate cyclase